MKDRFWGTLLGVLLTVALFFSGLFSWLTPLPLFYLARRYSLGRGLLAWALTILFFGIFYSFLFSFLGKESTELNLLKWLTWLPGMAYYEAFGRQAVLGSVFVYLSFFCSLSLLFAWMSVRETRVIRFVSVTMGGAALVSALVLVAFTRGQLPGFVHGISRYLGLVLDQFIALNQSAGVSGEEIAFIEKNRDLIIGSFLRVFPALLFSASLFLTWFNLVVVKRVFSPLGFFERLEDLSTFRLPFYSVWGVIGALSLFLANIYLWDQEGLSFVLINCFIVFLTLYFFQGLAIVSYYLALKGVTPWMRFMLYSLLLIFFQPLGLLLVGVGFFDSWFNFRKLNIHPTA